MPDANAPSTGTFELLPRGPFSLAASSRFLEGFVPAARDSSRASDRTDHLHFAFVPEGDEDAAGVCLRQRDGTVLGDVYGDVDPSAVRRQVERIMSLDVDATGFAEVGRRDPVMRALQERYPGLRPVTFFSPYEAAAWSLISHRVQMRQAARIKARMAEELGPTVAIETETWHAFPGPARLRQLEDFPGLFGRKVVYLRGLADAALEGRLSADRLRFLPPEEALAELKSLDGIGDFSAQLILLRGAGEPDYLASSEPRLAQAVALAYGFPSEPAAGQLLEMAEAWRPYRTWVAFLLRTMLEDETGEVTRGARRSRARMVAPRTARQTGAV